jgi:hypothetical protein
MSSSEEQNTPEEATSPIARKHSGLAVSSVTPIPKKVLFVDERKPSSMTVSDELFTLKSHLNNCEHTLIPVTAKMIHSSVSICNRFIMKDGRPLHMVKLFCAIRTYRESTKNIMINVEDGTGLVQVIV